MNTEFKEWVKVEKEKWIKELNSGGLFSGEDNKKESSQLESLLKQGEENIIGQVWHIV